MHAVEWQREMQPRPPLPLLTAADHQYHRKAGKPRLAYRQCRLSIVFIAAVSTAASGSFDLLSHRLCRVLGIPADLPLLSWLQHTTGPANTTPLATIDRSPVAYFVRDHECEYRQTLTSLRAHMLISWGAQEINMWSDYGTNRRHALSCDSIPLSAEKFKVRSIKW